jgi:SAM-dependent methyltransferase
MANPFLFCLVSEIRSALAGCKNVLDVGCGSTSPMRFVVNAHATGLDGYGPALEEARRNRTHNDFVLGDVKRIPDLFPNRRFDACIALDVIEHLEKQDGWLLLDHMERLATRRVVIFTPNGFIPQKSKDGDLQEHLSGWTAEDLRSRGYRVFGMSGPKSLRGEYHRIRYRPRPLWVVISILCHYSHTRSHAEKSAAIFCVKELRS